MEDPPPTSKPLMVYDGACDFCRRWVRRWRSVTRGRINYTPFQRAAERFKNIPKEQFESAAQLIEPDGQVYQGADAIFRALSIGARKHWPLWLYRFVPGAAGVTERVYGFVAGHRRGLSKVTNLLLGPQAGPPSYLLTRWLFVRLMGVIYLIAFASLGVQVLGLIGSRGILPVGDYLGFLHRRFGDDAYWRFPTLFWLNAGDQALQWACWSGVVGSVLVVLRIAPGPILVLLWALYFSLYRVGQTFLSFQWDILLLEAGFLTIFFASWKPWPRLRSDARPSGIMRWLIIWLLFRLMFCSGIVKLLDDNPNDPTWHQWTALTYHYETTCIPTPISWYAYQLPVWFHKLSVVCMFAIEIGVPFLFFLPRRLRILAFFLEVFLQVLIMLTGNYNFFNLLTIALCVALLDDAFLRRCFPRRLALRATARGRHRRPFFLQRMVTIPVAVLVLVPSVIWMSRSLRDRAQPWSLDRYPKVAQTMFEYSGRFALVSSYGLFRSMTTRRPEIIIEGSRDARTWQPYAFKWKPGNVRRRPPLVAPHQPRLDWQMWFAALGNARRTRGQWFLRFVKRLLEGSPDVLALLQSNPFPDKPPRYIRAVLYDYHFTDWAAHKSTGAWWTRKRLGLYLRPVSLRSFR